MIRPAEPADVEAVLELWSAARTQFATTPDTREAVDRLIAGSPGALLLAVEDGRVVGAVIAGWDGWRGTIHRLAVHPDRRRRGIAHALVRAGEERLRRLGAPKITALVVREDALARSFWSAAGYAEDRHTGRFVKNL